jgi:hypothetical protein
VLVDPAGSALGFYAVAVATDIRGNVNVAVAARGEGGVFLSSQGGKSQTFTHIGLRGKQVRVLAVQHEGPRSFLWAGVRVPGNAPGEGAFRLEVTGSAADWRQFQQGWTGVSCLDLAFHESRVYAGTFDAGVLWLDTNQADPRWQAPMVGGGLPIRDAERLFHPVDTVAVNPEGTVLLAGGPEGVYCSRDAGMNYTYISGKEFLEKVTLPETWLFCSGAHDITVVSEHETH